MRSLVWSPKSCENLILKGGLTAKTIIWEAKVGVSVPYPGFSCHGALGIRLRYGGDRKYVCPTCTFSFRNFPKEDHQRRPVTDPFLDIRLSSLRKKTTEGVFFKKQKSYTPLPIITTEGEDWRSQGTSPKPEANHKPATLLRRCPSNPQRPSRSELHLQLCPRLDRDCGGDGAVTLPSDQGCWEF